MQYKTIGTYGNMRLIFNKITGEYDWLRLQPVSLKRREIKGMDAYWTPMADSNVKEAE